MGLKTTNWTSKTTGHFYPTAYAKFRSFVFDENDRIRARFGIHTERKFLDDKTLQPMEIIQVNSQETGYKVDRTKCAQESLYEMAKTEVHEVEHWDEAAQKVVKVTVYGPLFGWQDDYV